MSEVNHGTLAAYQRGKCRCDDCRAAKAENQRDWSIRAGKTSPRTRLMDGIKRHPRPVIRNHERSEGFGERAWMKPSFIASCECGWESKIGTRVAVEREVIRHVSKETSA